MVPLKILSVIFGKFLKNGRSDKMFLFFLLKNWKGYPLVDILGNTSIAAAHHSTCKTNAKVR